MSEATQAKNTASNWLNVIVGVTIAIVALLGSFIAKAQSEASSAAAQASNQEQEKYYQAIGRQISGEADVNNAFGTEYQLWYRYNVQMNAAAQRGDLEAVQIFTGLRNAVEKTSTSHIFDAAYFNKENAKIDLALYKADIYIRDLYLLEEEQQAASEVSAAWDEKASMYGLQLTLLVVASFLLGLALMTKAKIPTLVFATTGIFAVVVISFWAYGLSLIPVVERPTPALEAFADGASLSDQGRWEAALPKFNAAIETAQGNYPNAYLHRAQVYSALKDFQKAIADYQVAKENGLTDDPTLNSSLVAAYVQTGDFETAIAIGTPAINNSPDDLLLRQQVAIALLASGKLPEATQENNTLILRAAKQVEVQQQLGDSPAEVWWLLNNAAYQYDLLIGALGSDNPLSSKVKDKEAVRKTAEIFAAKLRVQVLTLKYNLPATSAASADVARISEPQFILAATPDEKYTYKVGMKFQYKGLSEGQVLTIVVYRDNIEDPSWGFSQVWKDQSAEGTFNFTLSPSFDNYYIVPSGLYTVDIYVNDKQLSEGEFTVGEAALSSNGDQCDPLNVDPFEGTCNGAETLSLTDWPDYSDWPEWSANEALYYNCYFDPFGSYCELLPNTDSDGDGVLDYYDACPSEYGAWYDYGCPASASDDSDGDGLSNFDDYCPFDFGFAENYGCPMPTETDIDGDGTSNENDVCKDQPGPAENNGCPLTATDTDGDSLPDELDACPNDYGISADGCPQPSDTDSDGDGVLNDDDLCPDQTGPAENSGCPVTATDSDGDTIPDEFDACPSEYGISEDGCPAPSADDADGDGVLNNDDLCPDQTGPAENKGCPSASVDSDGDTVPDDSDACPTDYGTAADGCPEPSADDTDGDGVPNNQDQCVDQPGPADNNGCPYTTEPDADGDGTPDASDSCPTDPGPADNFGCPATAGDDTDGDGIADADDACPYDAGPASNGGCPDADSDGDGTPDNYDACPSDPGPADNSGCPVTDSDGDGLPDDVDACPSEAGPSENNGCPTPLLWSPNWPIMHIYLHSRVDIAYQPQAPVHVPRV